jgi:hypothetical protein
LVNSEERIKHIHYIVWEAQSLKNNKKIEIPFGEGPYVSMTVGIVRALTWLHHLKQRDKRQYTIQVNHLNYHSPVFRFSRKPKSSDSKHR